MISQRPINIRRFFHPLTHHRSPIDLLTMGTKQIKSGMYIWSLLLLFLAILSCHGQQSRNDNSDDATFRKLFTRVMGKSLSAMKARIFANSTVPHCASECVRETTFHCKSFDFDNARRACYLYKVNLDDRDIHLIPSEEVDHYKTNFVRLFHRLPNHMLTRTHNRRFDEISTEECARRCIWETYFKCRGFDYETSSRTCWLTELTPQGTEGVNIMEGFDYFSRISDGPLKRFVNYGFGRLKPLMQTEVYQKEVMGFSLEQCATACLAQVDSSFHCISFDFVFNQEESTCHMSKYLGANVYGLVSSQDYRVMHFEKKEKYLNFFYATPYSVLFGENHLQVSHVTPDRCARICLEQERFVCRSFDYRIEEGTCLLSSKTGSDVGGLYNQGLQEVHHFELKPIMDCGGNLTTEDGSIASPNWPRAYAPNEHCLWEITVPKHKVIHFHFTHLDLGLKYHDPCSEREDRITIVELSSRGPRETCVLPNTKNFVARSRQARLEFMSNDEIDGQGFRVFYSAEWTCDVHLSSAPGEIASPKWPKKYPPSTRCSWRITAPPGHRVSLHVNQFQLEKHTLGHCTEKYDHLTFLDGGTVRSPRIGLYCGRQEPFDVRSSGRDMFVQFVSDASETTTGFHATYKFEFQNGTTDIGLEKDEEDDMTDLEDSEILHVKGENDKKVKGDPTVHKHTQTDGGYNVANSEGLQGTSSRSNSGRYRSVLWAVLSTLLVVFVALAIILFLVWRHFRGKLTKQRQIVTEETPAEEVPLQEPYIKPNNELDFTGPSTSHTSTQFTNLLYGDTEKKVNIKNINRDSQ